jgi:hypothetical protein
MAIRSHAIWSRRLPRDERSRNMSSRQQKIPAFGRGVAPHGQRTGDHGLCPWGSIAMYDFLLEVKKRGMEAYTEFRGKIQDHPMGGPGFFGPLAGLVDLAGFPKMSEWEKKYLSPEQMEKYGSSLGSYDPRTGKGKH